MKRLIILSLLAGTTSFLFSQNNLSGTLTDAQTTKPIAGANVYISDLKIGASTDENGKYTLQNIPGGTYVVEARLIGYSLKTATVKIEGSVTQDFILAESENELQEVVVTGNSVGSEIQNTPVPIVEVPNSYLQQNASTNIIDALSKVPGVSGISDGQSITKPVIRGLGYNRVVTLNDGIRQEGQQWGDEFGIEVDPNSVDRVEILKGPASLAYGSDAISGVINLIPEKPLPEGEMKGDLLQNYQGNNGLFNTSLHAAGTKNGISWSGRITNIMAHAYQNVNDGYVFNSQFSNFAYDGTAGIHKNWGYSQLHFSYFNLKTGIVEGARDSATGKFTRTIFDGTNPIDVIATDQELKSYTPFRINQNVKHSKVVWDNSIAIGKGRILGKFAFQQNSRQEFNDPAIPNTANIFYFLNTVNYDVRYVSPDMNNFNVSVGANGMSQNSQNKGTLLLIPEYNLFDLGAFAIANKKIGKLNLSGGVRYDMRKFQGHDEYIDSTGNHLTASDPNAIHRFMAYSSNFNGISGSLGAAFNITQNFYLKVNVAKGFRAPNVAESGSNGIHDGTVVYEIGDPALKPESSLQFDFAAGMNSKDVTAEVDLFSNSISNFIYPDHLYTASGADSVNSITPGFAGAPVFKYSQGDVRMSGAEAVLDVHPEATGWLDFYASYCTVNSFLKNKPDSAKYLPFTPPARFRSELTFTAKKINKSFANIFFRVGMLYSFEQKNVYQASSVYAALSSYELAASKAPNAAYTLLNIGIGTDILAHGHKACTVIITVNNLADVAYMDYMSRFKYYTVNYNSNPYRVGVYNMGRNISVKLLVPLDFTK
jgi:iron complex outermembrane receptor protein